MKEKFTFVICMPTLFAVIGLSIAIGHNQKIIDKKLDKLQETVEKMAGK